MTVPSPTEINNLCKKDALAYGVYYIDLLNNRDWEVGSRAWIKDIYGAVNPYYIEKNPVGKAKNLVIQKSTQCGMSTMGIVRLFHLLDYWSLRVMYTLPRLQDVSDFSTTRLDPMIRASKRLKEKLGAPDSTHAKQIGDSFVYISEMTVEPRMLPIDALFNDEIDLSDPDNIGTAQNRMDASYWKLNYNFSTPTLPNYGINALYLSSDMRQWYVKCPACNHWQIMDWGYNLRVLGPPQEPSEVFYGCQKCDEELTLDIIQHGEWVPEYPEKSNKLIGFHVSQMMTHPAIDLYTSFRDPRTTLMEFHRKRLGKPYEVEGGSLERSDFLAYCFDEPYEPEFIHDNYSSYYMGVDQGNELQVIIAKVEKGSTLSKIVHVEIVPFSDGFEKIGKLMKIFKIRKAVIDADPNRHAARNVQDDFPGKIILADYADQKVRFTTKKLGGKKFVTNTVIDRTAGFDHLFESIKEGAFALPGDPSNLESDIELLIDHVTALKRDVETRRTASGEKQVGVWRNARPDHLAHAALYLKTAIEIDKGKGFRVVIIGKKEDEPVVEEDKNKPKQEDMIGIIALLAEVPPHQLSGWLVKKGHTDYEPPFPLSFKLGKAEARYKVEDIEWTVNFMLKKS